MPKQNSTRVREIMTSNPPSAEMESTIEEIASIMKEQGVGALPIVDEDGELVGMVTERDIVVLCIAEGNDPSDCRAEDILRAHLRQSGLLQSASPEMEMTDAARIMAEYQVQSLPVLDKGRLVGMISRHDIAGQHEREDGGRGNQPISRKKAG
jgi:CBS domain-containing protein